jgi:hypothetical protein
LPPRSEAETGTSILVVDPLLGNEDLLAVGDEVVETILWNFWPRMTRTTPSNRRLSVRVEVEGVPVPVPDPEDCPPLDLFAEAMAAHREKRASRTEILCKKPRMHLGFLDIQKGVRAERSPMAMRDGSLIPKQCCHIALMRPVELVVKYIEGDPFPDKRFEWAGVFICADEDEVEGAFASAEPPAHDDWIPDNLPKGREKTFVRVALREIEGIARTHATPTTPLVHDVDKGPSLAATATKMGRFLSQVSARGPGRPKSKGGRTSGGRKPISISPAVFSGLVHERGAVVAVFRATLKNDGSDESLQVVAIPRLVADGGLVGTEDLPGGFDLRVNSMTLADSCRSADQDWLHVGSSGGELEVRVPTPKGAAVGLRLELRAGASV